MNRMIKSTDHIKMTDFACFMNLFYHGCHRFFFYLIVRLLCSSRTQLMDVLPCYGYIIR